MKPINFDGMIMMVPDYAKFVTKDADGNIYASEYKPEWFDIDGKRFYMQNGQHEWLMCVKHEPSYLELVK